jgi:hypothetical protein
MERFTLSWLVGDPAAVVSADNVILSKRDDGLLRSVRVTTSHHLEMTMYFNASGQIVETEYSQRRVNLSDTASERSVMIRNVYSDFRRVEGLEWPYKVSVTADGQPQETWTIQKYEPNVLWPR